MTQGAASSLTGRASPIAGTLVGFFPSFFSLLALNFSLFAVYEAILLMFSVSFMKVFEIN